MRMFVVATDKNIFIIEREQYLDYITQKIDDIELKILAKAKVRGELQKVSKLNRNNLLKLFSNYINRN